MIPWTWKIYYEGGATFDSTQGRPEDASAFSGYGVEAIAQENGTDLFSSDYYIFRESYGVWIEAKLDGLIDHSITAAADIVAVLAGRTIPTPDWKSIMEQMNAERRHGDR